MKKKPKLNPKQLVFEHGEKAVLALGVLLLVGFAYSFFGHPSLPVSKGPSELTSKADAAMRHMEESVWDEKRAGIAVTDYVKRAKRDPLASEDYALLNPFDSPIKESKRKRGQPKLFAFEQLRVTSGMGAFEVKPPKVASETPKVKETKKKKSGAAPEVPEPPTSVPRRVAGAVADGTLKGRSWAMITGLVPIKKQMSAYDEVFKDTIPTDAGTINGQAAPVDRLRDIEPQYCLPHVERAEVVDGKEGPFEPLKMLTVANIINEWATYAADVVSLDYVDSEYTMPLGPLHGAEWGEEAAHAPEIPLATVEELERDKALEEEAAKAKEEMDQATELAPFGAKDENSARNGRRSATKTKTRTDPNEKPEKELEYRLFRFADFTVESGKTYRYRVRWSVENPNYQLLDKFLKNPEFKQNKTLELPMSAATPPVTIRTSEGELVAAPTYVRNQSEAPANMMLFTLEPETGLRVSAEMSVKPGTVMNLTKEVETIAGPKVVDFRTNSVVLDVRGGRSLPGRDRTVLEPSEVLFWNASLNRLDARNEMEDVEAVSELEEEKVPDPMEPQLQQPMPGNNGGLLGGAPTPRGVKGRAANKKGATSKGGPSSLLTPMNTASPANPPSGPGGMAPGGAPPGRTPTKRAR